MCNNNNKVSTTNTHTPHQLYIYIYVDLALAYGLGYIYLSVSRRQYLHGCNPAERPLMPRQPHTRTCFGRSSRMQQYALLCYLFYTRHGVRYTLVKQTQICIYEGSLVMKLLSNGALLAKLS